MAAGKDPDPERRERLGPPRLQLFTRYAGILRAAEDGQWRRERRACTRPMRLESGDVRAESRKQQVQQVPVLQYLGRNAAIATADFVDEGFVRKVPERGIGIRQVRRSPSRHDQVR